MHVFVPRNEEGIEYCTRVQLLGGLVRTDYVVRDKFCGAAFPSKAHIVSTSVIVVSPICCRVAIEWFAAASLPNPQASRTKIGQKPRSDAWRHVGSIPISSAIPTTMKLRMPQSRNAMPRNVPSNADIVILSIIASPVCGSNSGTI